MALYDIFTRLVCVHIEAHPVSVAAGVFGSRFLWVSDPLGHMVALLVLLEYDGVSKCFRSNSKNHCNLVCWKSPPSALGGGTWKRHRVHDVAWPDCDWWAAQTQALTVQRAELGTLDKWHWKKEANIFRRWRRPEGSISLSLDMQDIALFQPKASLVFIKEVQQGLDVHLVIEVHHLLCGILNFWHCDWLSN